ncbi:MAG: glutamine synthetase III [Bacteroidota bacterium]
MNPRYKATEYILNRKAASPSKVEKRAAEIFGENVFHKAVMRRYLSDSVYQALTRAMENGEVLDKNIASPVAEGIKAWAIDKGATHFTHWFQPLTGRTAEKHQSFLDFFEGEAIDKFSGTELSQQKPDASAFPSGGLRTTFEARGYTAWDSSSPVFILDTTFGTTLCIPTIFVSYTGQSLDYKMPLLRSISAINQAALELCELFGQKHQKITPSLGLEQEYFLVDKQYYFLRPDLYQSGRTLFGAPAARGQHMHDQYFAAIPERVYAFMNDLEWEAHRMGIPLKTRHNEMAPGQFECVPIYENMNVAIDHGLMIMDLIDRIAHKHEFVALLHEKPFEGISGSSKHNNWSLMTESGRNLLAPGSKPEENLLFLSFFVSVIRSVWQYAPLLEASLMSAGNEKRLGKQDAPPMDMSIFVGRQLNKVLNDIENPPRRKKNEQTDQLMHLGIASIPELLLDNTDNNRTSPFAFTGDKFEIRAVGASSNSSLVMTILNTIVADQLFDFRARVQGKMNRGRPLEAAAVDMLREYIAESKGIRREGDYMPAETKSADTASPTLRKLRALTTFDSIKLFKLHKVMTEEELTARQTVLEEKYHRQVEVEAMALVDLVQTQLIPLVHSYQDSLITLLEKKQRLNSLKNVKGRLEEQTLLQLEEILTALHEKAILLHQDQETQNREEDGIESLLTLIAEARVFIDQLEGLIPDELWPFPKYREMLFLR